MCNCAIVCLIKVLKNIKKDTNETHARKEKYKSLHNNSYLINDTRERSLYRLSFKEGYVFIEGFAI